MDGPPERALVRSRGRAFITAREYNAWLGTYPLSLTSDDPGVARRQALEQMAAFKLILERARLTMFSGKDRPSGEGLDNKSLVLSYIRDQVTSLSATVTERQAEEYLAAHREMFEQLDQAKVPSDFRMMAIRGSVGGELLWGKVQIWMRDAGLTYEEKL
jgi:hypothetical protein